MGEWGEEEKGKEELEEEETARLWLGWRTGRKRNRRAKGRGMSASVPKQKGPRVHARHWLTAPGHVGRVGLAKALTAQKRWHCCLLRSHESRHGSRHCGDKQERA